MRGAMGLEASRGVTRRHAFGWAAGAAGAVLLAECGPASRQQGAQLTTQHVDLTYLTWDQARPDLLPTLTEVLQGFTAKYPNLKAEPVPFGGDQRAKLVTAVAAGTPPDVADAHHQHVRDLGPSGTIQDITRYLKRDPYPKEYVGWEPYQWQGKQYAVPWGVQASCTFYNKALFDQAGLPVPPTSWTWDSFIDAARRLTKPAPDDTQSLWGAADYGGRNYQYINALLTTFGGSILSPSYTESTLTSAASLAALQFRAEWVPKLQITPPAGLSGVPGSVFFEGRLAMQIVGSWFISNTKASQLGREPTWDVAPLPKGPKRRAGLAHETGLSLPTGIQHPEEAWALLKYLTSLEGVLPFARVGRTVPANRKGWDAAVPPDGRPSRYREAILNVWDEEALVPPFTPRIDDVLQIWNTELDPVWNGQRPPRDGAEAFKQRMNTLLQELKGQGLL